MATAHMEERRLSHGIRTIALALLLMALSLPMQTFAGTYGDGAYDAGAYDIGGSPAISSISSGTPGETGATITWTTDVVANSQVAYGTTSAYGATTTLDSTLVASHSVPLSGLSASTTYHFQIITIDASSSVATSSDQTFATAAAPVTSGGGGGGGGGGGPVAGSIGSGALVNVNAIPPAVGAATSSLGAVATASATTSPTAAAPQSFVFARNLQLGAQGNDVRELQIYLNTHGFPVALSGVGSAGQESEYFGPATQAALAKLQVSIGITTDTGYFGPRTRASIATSVPAATSQTVQTQAATSTGFQFTRNLAFGTVDAEVKELQEFLNTQGFTIATSGPGSPGNEIDLFGNKTLVSLIKFQEAHAEEILSPFGLTKGTGVFGTTTRNYVNGIW